MRTYEEVWGPHERKNENDLLLFEKKKKKKTEVCKEGRQKKTDLTRERVEVCQARMGRLWTSPYRDSLHWCHLLPDVVEEVSRLVRVIY